VADEALALLMNIVKPYAVHSPGSLFPDTIFSYRLSREHRIVENVFDTLSAKFRVFFKPAALHPNKVEAVCLTYIYLHNFLCGNTVLPQEISVHCLVHLMWKTWTTMQ
jgi:hypothetical protein